MKKVCFTLILLWLMTLPLFAETVISRNHSFAMRLFHNYYKYNLSKYAQDEYNLLSPYAVGQGFALLSQGAKGNTLQSILRAISSPQQKNGFLFSTRIPNSEPLKTVYLYSYEQQLNNIFYIKQTELLKPLEILPQMSGHKVLASGEYSQIHENFPNITAANMHALDPMSIFVQSQIKLNSDYIIDNSHYFLIENIFVNKKQYWQALQLKCHNHLCPLVIKLLPINNTNSPWELIANKLPIFQNKYSQQNQRLKALIEELTNKSLENTLFGQLKKTNTSYLKISAPIDINITQQRQLTSVINNSGLSLCFSPPADFTGFDASGGLRLHDVYQYSEFTLASEKQYPSTKNSLPHQNNNTKIIGLDAHKDNYLLIFFDERTHNLIHIISHRQKISSGQYKISSGQYKISS